MAWSSDASDIGFALACVEMFQSRIDGLFPFAVRCWGQSLEGRAGQIFTWSSQGCREFVRKGNGDVSQYLEIINIIRQGKYGGRPEWSLAVSPI